MSDLHTARLENLKKLYTHPWYARMMKKLTLSEITFCTEWIQSHEHLDRAAYEKAVNRIYIENPGQTQHRHWKEILEILTVSNGVSDTVYHRKPF